ncbi:MAG TPA: hypothetical protein VNO20_06305 [Solirubrobacterales bacterium]|nr:hypothetical protein [Solirubrobacterales bacterium]
MPHESMARLFALDHNFPEPIVEVLSEVQEGSGDADLVSVSDIDPRMADLDDWQIMLALHHHERPWDGLITTDSSILNQPPELAVLLQTKLTLIVAMAAGDDPIKATGLLFAYLGGICSRTDPDTSQVWKLRAASRAADRPWDDLKRAADHQHRNVEDLWQENRLGEKEFAADPLAEDD